MINKRLYMEDLYLYSKELKLSEYKHSLSNEPPSIVPISAPEPAPLKTLDPEVVAKILNAAS